VKTKDKNIKTFNQHLNKRYAETGTKERTDFEIKAKSFALGELIKEERKLAHLMKRIYYPYPLCSSFPSEWRANLSNSEAFT
jgi:hypothetical protein